MNTDPVTPSLNLPEYLCHGGTLKISGSTVPRKAAWRAFSLLEAKVKNVEFLFIGASAGQQTVKSIGILSDLFSERYYGEFIVVFQPMRFKTTIANTEKEVDAQVWRSFVIDMNAQAVLTNDSQSRS